MSTSAKTDIKSYLNAYIKPMFELQKYSEVRMENFFEELIPFLDKYF